LRKNIVKINKETCKSCLLCIKECKQGIIKVSNDTNSFGYHPAYITEQSLCTGCTLCAISCPDAAIEVFREED
jgi:2-oxoglutarate ferredoxin oxidoreductase subunit delta